MARSANTNKQATLPTHELALKITLPNGEQRTIGYIGLFTDNNKMHAGIAEMNAERLATLVTKLTATVVEYGERSESSEINFGF